MSFFFFIFFFILFIFSEKINSSELNKRDLQSDTFDNIRIYIDDECLGYQSSASDPSQNNTNTELTKEAIKKARLTLEKIVKVQRLTEYVDLQNYKTVIPSEFSTCAARSLNSRLDYDLFIFIRSPKPLDEDDVNFPITNIISYVGNDVNNRPLIATINYRYSLTDTDAAKMHAISILFLHEFTHILGFTKSILQRKGIFIEKTIKDRINGVDRLKKFITGDKVINMAKKYFNCSSIDGVEIDDTNGLDGADNIHWNGRILLGEYMTSEFYFMDQAISEITLALL